MNKLMIPSILGAIVAIAGIFALSPVEQASTAHTTIIQDIVQDVTGASLEVSTAEMSFTFGGAEDRFQYIWLESDEVFTVKEFEIDVTLANNMVDNGDVVRLYEVGIVAGEYATTAAGINDATVDDDNGYNNICSAICDTILRGDDSVQTLIASGSAMLQDQENVLNMTIVPGMTLFMALEFEENNGNAGDIDATITFYLSGPDAEGDVTIILVEDQEEPHDDD